MMAWISMTVGQEYSVAHEFLDRAVEIIEWGRTVWKNVSSDDRGAIFELTFLRLVRALRMAASMKARHLMHYFIQFLTRLSCRFTLKILGVLMSLSKLSWKKQTRSSTM